VDVAREGPVALVTLNRPPVNALSPELMDRLSASMHDLAADEDVRVVVLTGAGRAFCAGGDVAAFAAMDDDELMEAIRAGQRLVWDLEHLDRPTIAAVNGACLGGGNGVAMACDLRIASEDAVFGHPEASLGLTLAYAGSARLARLVGPARAKELMFTARRLSAREALGIGLVNEVVPGPGVLPRALAVKSAIRSLNSRFCALACEGRWSKVALAMLPSTTVVLVMASAERGLSSISAISPK